MFFFGWYSEYFLDTPYDSFLKRLPIAIIGWALFIASYKSKFVLKYLRQFFLVGSCLAIYQYVGIFDHSNYHYYFSIGLTSMPFIAFTLFFHAIDVAIYFLFLFICCVLIIHDVNPAFITVYLIDSLLAVCIYFFVIKSRSNLLKKLKTSLQQLEIKQDQIEGKNRSLIKIGELATQVAHDIRSPVIALEAISQMLGNEVDPKKKQLIENAAKRINDIANNLVSEYRVNLTKDLSSIKIDRTINLNSLIEDIVEEKKLSLDPKHKIIVRALENIVVPKNLNSTEFQRVISNLINNSIEAFDKENGIVDIELYRKENKIKLTIRDNGKGISSEEISTVFKKGTSGKEKGAGLGLSHAKEYIESLNGSITLESVPGQETKITIII
jgi:signal transduction histidine kinase